MDISRLIEVLQLEEVGEGKFVGYSLDVSARRIFGGQIVAQAIIAAHKCGDTARRIHSAHANFLRPGNPSLPIEFEAVVLSMGRTFSTTRVNAYQDGRLIFTMNASFVITLSGLDHQTLSPDVPRPADLPSRDSLFALHPNALPKKVVDFWNRPRPIEVRPVGDDHYLEPTKKPPQLSIWLKANGAVPNQPILQSAILAYISDLTLLEVATFPHGYSALDDAIDTASLDHAIWFHRDVDLSQWLLSSQDSPSASAGLGFARSQIFMEDGSLVASTAQHGQIKVI
jgi:acyl-CoA thioesterase-2